MANGEITKALISCLNGDSIDTVKFFTLYPQTDNIKNAIYELKRKGYLNIDEGDNRILCISATSKLLKLAKEVQ